MNDSSDSTVTGPRENAGTPRTAGIGVSGQ